jgi:putative PEP-CTERM system histidine kinase
MTLSERITKEGFSLEDMELLKAVADQTAANLSNLCLSKELLQAKELEAFQSVSAFFVHDLKNLAATLSLTVKNLPLHFDNPEYRKDALRAIAQSVETINSVCASISLINKQLELQRTKVDLNQLVTDLLAQVNGSIKVPLSFTGAAVPKVLLDSEQMQKVLLNLLLNANEATGPEGEIQVTTGQSNGWITVSVKDNGCGMPENFIQTSLFKPFRTSKKHGLGIGLFHSKKIVESHQGTIEVESEVGKGSTFRVMLPVGDGVGGERV